MCALGHNELDLNLEFVECAVRSARRGSSAFPKKSHHGHLRDLSPLLQAHRSPRLKARPIQFMMNAPYRWAAQSSEAVAEY